MPRRQTPRKPQQPVAPRAGRFARPQAPPQPLAAPRPVHRKLPPQHGRGR